MGSVTIGQVVMGCEGKLKKLWGEGCKSVSEIIFKTRYFICVVELGIESRALKMLGKSSTIASGFLRKKETHIQN